MKTVLFNRAQCVIIGFLCMIFSACATLFHTPFAYDTAIVNGKILDGTGNPWYYADIAIFNPEELIDKATFQQPHQFVNLWVT